MTKTTACDHQPRTIESNNAGKRGLRSVRRGLLALASLAASAAFAAEPQGAAAPAGAPPAAPAGILPLPNYSGDFLNRQYLTGNWWGARDALAKKGIQFDVDWTQTVQSVVSGGPDTGTRYGGTLDYNLMLDLYRMGLLPGALIKIRGESRYGESVNDLAGSLLPVNTDGFFPLTDDLDENVPITVTNLAYYQFFCEQFGFMVGKFDTLDGDANEFASGRGKTQFLNSNLVFNPASLVLAPYSTLGAGVIIKPIDQITVSSLVFNTDDSSTSSGFEDFGNGWTWVTEADFQYRLWDLPGGTNIGVMYARDQAFAEIGERFVFEPGQGFSVPTKNESWLVTWSGWQYLWAEKSDRKVLDTTNGRPDLKGFGLFWRTSIADRDTNVIEWFASGGVGGRGLIPGRDNDLYGLGYYYTSLQTGRLLEFLGVADHVQGVEAFYSLALTPAASLTFDIQVIEDALPGTETAVVIGARFLVRF